jgi:DNA-directed RNA polymerase subunit RPC12/RpoP
MAKQPLTLICETCGRKFEAHARRRVVHCQECAEELRHKSLGPVQIKGKPTANPIFGKPQVKEIAWEHSHRDLIYYLNRFNRFPAYDSMMPSDPDQITDEDRRIANQLAARMSAEIWAQIVGQSIEKIGDWDLLNMSDSEWQNRKKVIYQVLGVLVEYPGIGIARLTKALHRKRPRLIPVCDSVVLNALGVATGNKADRIIACMDGLRIVGRKQLSRLHELRKLSKQLGAEMTELRILELLYWVQFGPFPPAN